MDLAYLGRLRYIKISGPRTWWWKVSNTNLIQLPVDDEDNCLKPVLSLSQDNTTPVDFQYYLLTGTDRSEGSSIGGGPDAAPSVNLIPPLGDYSSFQHYPFHQGPYQPAGYDAAQFPPTFATYPPFVEPRVWNQNARDSMLFGLCNQMHQVNLDRSLGDHNIYSYHAESGHFPTGTQHPAYYMPVVEQNEANNPVNDQTIQHGVQQDHQDFQNDRSETDATAGYRHFTDRYVIQDSDDDEVDPDDAVEIESGTIATGSDDDSYSYVISVADSGTVAEEGAGEATGYVVADSETEEESVGATGYVVADSEAEEDESDDASQSF